MLDSSELPIKCGYVGQHGRRIRGAKQKSADELPRDMGITRQGINTATTGLPIIQTDRIISFMTKPTLKIP